MDSCTYRIEILKQLAVTHCATYHHDAPGGVRRIDQYLTLAITSGCEAYAPRILKNMRDYIEMNHSTEVMEYIARLCELLIDVQGHYPSNTRTCFLQKIGEYMMKFDVDNAHKDIIHASMNANYYIASMDSIIVDVNDDLTNSLRY